MNNNISEKKENEISKHIFHLSKVSALPDIKWRKEWVLLRIEELRNAENEEKKDEDKNNSSKSSDSSKNKCRHNRPYVLKSLYHPLFSMKSLIFLFFILSKYIIF